MLTVYVSQLIITKIEKDMEEYKFQQKAPQIQELLNQVGSNTTRINEIETTLGNLAGKSSFGPSDLIDGFYRLNVSPVPTQIFHYTGPGGDYGCLQVDVKAGDSATITTHGGTDQGRAYALTDESRNVLAVAEPSVVMDNTVVTAEVDGFLIVNCTNSHKSSFQMSLDRAQAAPEVSRLSVNPPVSLKKVGLRVLDIGNSFSLDSLHYVNELIDAAGLPSDFSFYVAERGGGTFKAWYDIYNDADDKTYYVAKVFGNSINGVQTGSSAGTDGSLFRQLLFAGWDLIIIRTKGEYATNYDLWSGDGEGGYLKEYIRILRKSNPNATIGYAAIHSFRSSYSFNTEHSSLLRWQKQMTTCKRFMADYGISFVVPYGTAVQNLRASSLSDDDEFSEDGRHMADGLGDYVSSCAYFQALIAPRYGISVIGNTWTKTDFDETQPGVVNITAANALLAQKAAFAACCDMFSIVNPDTMDYHDDTEQPTQDYPDPAAVLEAKKADKPLSGTFSNRPTTGLYAGLMYYDTTLHKPIYYGGDSVWYDADGNEITQ